ncbi:MAG: shikimate kinase [Hyphomicrobiales bacterium]|nr:shikimate kinase [Hyphomicrobiales bacterium]
MSAKKCIASTPVVQRCAITEKSLPSQPSCLDVSSLGRRSIVLVGLMGAGKSCVGRRMAAQLDLPFADADDEIAKVAGMSIPAIFESLGEQAFRDGERRVIARLVQNGPQVLATGGGAFLDPDTRHCIRENGISIWLKAELDILEKRTRGRSGRPLLRQSTLRETLASLIKIRYPVYAEADIIVESMDKPAERTVNDVLGALTAYLETSAYQCGNRP